MNVTPVWAWAITLKFYFQVSEITWPNVGIYADQRIGEILRELPKAKAGRKSNDSTAVEELPTKAGTLKEAGIKAPTAYQLEQLAANPEVVEAVIAMATEAAA